MALTDYYDNASTIDTMSWAIFSWDVLIARLAALYIKEERNISNRSRNYDGPTMGTVRLFVKSRYKPVRGQGVKTFTAVLAEVERQKAIRNKRSEVVPYSPPTPYSKLSGWHRSNRRSERMQKVARERFSITYQTYWDKAAKVDPDIGGMVRVDGTLFIIHMGTYNTDTIIFMHDRKRGIKKAVATGHHGGNVYDVLLKLGPPKASELLLMGATLKLDVVNEGFELNGELIPWRAKHIYRSDELHKIQRAWKEKGG